VVATKAPKAKQRSNCGGCGQGNVHDPGETINGFVYRQPNLSAKFNPRTCAVAPNAQRAIEFGAFGTHTGNACYIPPPLAAEIGGGATPYLINRGYIEVMVDVRGSGD
jgi:hypothetical protein